MVGVGRLAGPCEGGHPPSPTGLLPSQLPEVQVRCPGLSISFLVAMVRFIYATCHQLKGRGTDSERSHVISPTACSSGPPAPKINSPHTFACWRVSLWTFSSVYNLRGFFPGHTSRPTLTPPACSASLCPCRDSVVVFFSFLSARCVCSGSEHLSSAFLPSCPSPQPPPPFTLACGGLGRGCCWPLGPSSCLAHSLNPVKNPFKKFIYYLFLGVFVCFILFF